MMMMMLIMVESTLILKLMMLMFVKMFMSHLFIVIKAWTNSSHQGQCDGSLGYRTYSTGVWCKCESSG